MILPPDFKELLEELARAKVEFLLIGGYAAQKSHIDSF